MNVLNPLRLVSKLAAASLVVALCAGCSTVVEHPDFAKRRAGMRHIAVVTPNVEFHSQAPRSRQNLPDKEGELRTNLIAAITCELGAKGFTVEFPQWKSLATVTNANCETLAMLEAIDRAGARTNFYHLLRMRRPKDGPALQWQEDASSLARLSAADTIAFVQLNAYTNTPGQQSIVAVGNFLSFIGGVAGAAAGVPLGGRFDPLYGSVSVQFMLVEGATGEPLWANFARTTAEHPSLDQLVNELLKPLPALRQESGRASRGGVPIKSESAEPPR